MKIKNENQSSYVKFDVADKKISDKFKTNGRICEMMLEVKSNEMGNMMKMKIGKTILTDKELIDMNCPYQPDGKILFLSGYMEHAIEFNKDDVFEFEQPSDNVSEINIWFTQLEAN